MRSWAVASVLIATSLVTSPVWAVPEAMGPPPSGDEAGQSAGSYEEGLKLVEQADQALADASKETDAARREEATKVALETYSQARNLFEQLTRSDPTLPGGWNMLGYCERKLGNYDAALDAYRRALTLRPTYAEAIAYRGEAYLGLNQIAAAKQAYLDLFPLNQTLAAQYLDAMRAWIATRRQAPAGLQASTLDRLEQWINERAKIAATTTALTREGAAEHWRHAQQ
jgi:tetratricopeptide (TPR) repeat protein